MNEKATLANQFRAANFAAYDMLLYLDTHPKDKRAFEMFRSLVEKATALKQEYEEKYGSLTPFNSAYKSEFDWLDNPWPWDKEVSE